MRRVEALDSRVTESNDKTDSIILNLRSIDSKLVKPQGSLGDNKILASLDQKVSNIDSKLATLKNQLDSNFLPADDINAEASEKKPISLSSIDVSKVLNGELEALRGNMANIDRKLQFHINVVSESLGKMLTMMSDIHEAVVEPVMVQTSHPQPFRNRTTTPATTVIKNSKLDKLVRQMHPMLSVSNKMDEVWNVVVGTKSSVDDLVPKSDELLTQTQRQERAISDIHADLRTNTNKIIANLDMVEKRLKKQEEDVVTLAQRPVAAELLLDPTIDRLVEFDQNRYSVDGPDDVTEQAPLITFTTPTPVANTPTSTTAQPILTSQGSVAPAAGKKNGSSTRNRGVIFPSVKNKPAPANTTFTTDQVAITFKDVKRKLKLPTTRYWYFQKECTYVILILEKFWCSSRYRVPNQKLLPIEKNAKYFIHLNAEINSRFVYTGNARWLPSGEVKNRVRPPFGPKGSPIKRICEKIRIRSLIISSAKYLNCCTYNSCNPSSQERALVTTEWRRFSGTNHNSTALISLCEQNRREMRAGRP
ncbi:unnamed protein product [Nesidiocoris tenuis]|uniref:Uncharacterized protein n=1 Tax=Nesidiocoris tenuis TaxID=355587 RepID=A0A6H5GRH8_9HEMI|nr:unnamed protein product [Nesidiocoris tenuis]